MNPWGQTYQLTFVLAFPDRMRGNDRALEQIYNWGRGRKKKNQLHNSTSDLLNEGGKKIWFILMNNAFEDRETKVQRDSWMNITMKFKLCCGQ